MVVCDKPYHRTNIHHRHIVLSRNNEFYRNSLLHKKGGLYPPNPVILTHLATNIYFWWFNWIITCKASFTDIESVHHFSQAVDLQISQGICTDNLANILYAAVISNQLFSCRNICTKIGHKNGGELILTCTSLAPASLSIFTIRSDVVPRTIESSIMIILLPSTASFNTFSFTRTLDSRLLCLGLMKVLPTYLFLMNPIS